MVSADGSHERPTVVAGVVVTFALGMAARLLCAYLGSGNQGNDRIT
jgi:hypothetical protein